MRRAAAALVVAGCVGALVSASAAVTEHCRSRWRTRHRCCLFGCCQGPGGTGVPGALTRPGECCLPKGASAQQGARVSRPATKPLHHHATLACCRTAPCAIGTIIRQLPIEHCHRSARSLGYAAGQHVPPLPLPLQTPLGPLPSTHHCFLNSATPPRRLPPALSLCSHPRRTCTLVALNWDPVCA